jgi:hypothetical protein
VRTAAENQAKLEELIPLMGWGTASDTADTADEIQSIRAAEERTDNSRRFRYGDGICFR